MQADAKLVRRAVEPLVVVPASYGTQELAERIAYFATGRNIEDITQVMDPFVFTGGEFGPKFLQPMDLEGKTVYLVGTTSPDESAQELSSRLGIAADAARESGAARVLAVLPELPYSRQDRGRDVDPKMAGQGVSARRFARTLRNDGIEQVITLHLHSPRVYDFYAEAWGVPDGREVLKSISPEAILTDYLMYHSSLRHNGTRYLEDGGAGIVFCAPDAGNKRFLESLRTTMRLENSHLVLCKKERGGRNDPNGVRITVQEISPNLDTLDGKLVLTADDIVDTGGTLMSVLDRLYHGTTEGIRIPGRFEECLIYGTHAVLASKAHWTVQQRLMTGIPGIREVVFTNSWPYISAEQHPLMKRRSTILRVAELFGDAIVANEIFRETQDPEFDVNRRYCPERFSTIEEQHAFLHARYARLYVLKRHSTHFMNPPPREESREVFIYR